MSRRDWGYYAALGGLTLALVRVGDGVGQPASDAPHTNAPAKQQQTPATSPPPKTSEAAKARCKGAKEGEADTDCYARRAAEATERQADDADTGVILGWVQAGGLLLSLFFTGWAALSAARATKVAHDAQEDAEDSIEVSRLSAEAAKLSAKASADTAAEAARANAIASETARLDLRPYVYLSDVKTDWRGGWMMGLTPTHGEVIITMKNYGRTPAKNVRFQARTLIGGPWNEDFSFDVSRAFSIPAADIPPGDSKTQEGYHVVGLNEQINDFIQRDGQSLFVEGRITYEGGDGSKYSTKFRRASSGKDHYPNGTFIPTPGGNSST
ncbi:MAG TPA: hypothetical protein VFN88_06495, partial [Caulobacteraceae bacterium]|nr:hypothetical protein [Caulobacteraceae bacterium]